MHKHFSWLNAVIVGVALAASLCLVPQRVLAADGSGTNTVLPTSVTASSTGNTLNFTFTAGENMDSGDFSITVPGDWSTPSGTGGSSGYTTVTSGAGTVANVLDNADSATGWSAGSACSTGLSATTTVKQEGSASIACRNGNESTGDAFYKNITTEDWSAYTTVGFWVRTSASVAANRLQFAYDDTANLASPITTLNIPAISANTWTYVTLTLTGTRTSVVSYGFALNHNSALDNITIFIDDILIGPGVPTFPGGGVILVDLLNLANGQTVVVSYGSGGGSSGATAPITGRVSTFTTKTRANDAGTLTTIASSPTVTVNNPAPTLSSISPTTKNVGDSTFTLTLNGTNFNASSTAYFSSDALTTTYVSSTQITASVAGSRLTTAGSINITVFNPTPGGGASTAQVLSINNPTPSLSGVSPASASTGDPDTPITLTGTNFVTGSIARLNGANLATTYNSSTQLTATVASSSLLTAGTFNIAVFNPTPGGGTSTNQVLTVNNVVPTITSLSPSSVEAGGMDFTLTVNGTGYASDAVIHIDLAPLATTFIDAVRLTATVPSSYITVSSSHSITVFNPGPGGGTSTERLLQATDTTPPAITITAPTKTASSTITNTTIHVVNTSILAASVIVDPSTTAGTTSFNCVQTSGGIVDCTISITSSGNLSIKATDAINNSNTKLESGYVIDTAVPSVTITAPTKALNATITNTTVRVTDNNAITASNVIIDPSTTAGTSGLSCLQTSGTVVDCTLSITSSGNLTIRATDDAGNTAAVTETNYIIESTVPVVTITAPLKIYNDDITNTTIRVTDNSAILAANVIVDPSTTAGNSGFSCTQTSSTAIDCMITITSSGTLVIKGTDNASNNTTGTETGYIIEAVSPVVTITAPTKISNATITSTTIHVTDNSGILAASVIVNDSTSAGTSSFVCTQTSSTAVDCTISITSSGNLVIRATDRASNITQQSETGYMIEATVPVIAFTAPTTASSTSITNTTIRVTDNNAILSTSVIVDPSTTAGTSGFSCTQTGPAIVDCAIVITSSGNLTIKATDRATNVATLTRTGYIIESTPPSVTITAPTKTSNVDITNTTIHVTDNSAILSTNVIVDPSTTVSVHAFSCTQTSSTAVDCTLHIDTSGNLVIKATDNAGNITTQSENNYVIEATPPVIAFTVPTTASSTAITNTTIRITDLNALLAVSVTVATSTTAGTSGFSCTQTSGTIVDCTISITSSGNLAIRTVDVAGNVRTDTQTGYVIEAVLPIVTITAPTKTSLSTITDTTIRVTDNYGVLAANVSVDPSSTVITDEFSCTQTSSTAVDCTIHIDTSGSFVIRAIDAAGNIGTRTEAGYVIEAILPEMTFNSPTMVSSTAITNTTIQVTDNNAILSTSVIVATSTTAGVTGFSCMQTSGTMVDCTLTITSSGNLVIAATDVAGNVHTDVHTGYVIESVVPVILITAPTKTAGDDIEDTTIHVTDNNALLAASVIIDLTTTAGAHDFSCTQTSSTAVDCVVEIDSSGDLTIRATDVAGNVATASETGYVISRFGPTIHVTAPTHTSSTAITNTTIRVTDATAVASSDVVIDGSTTAGTSGFNCLQTSPIIVDCTIIVTSSGDLTIVATNSGLFPSTTTERGYVIESTAPVIAITAPTKASSTHILNTTIHVTDNNAIVAGSVAIDPSTTVLVHNLICTQTSSIAVDCSVDIETSGNLVLRATDVAGNVATQTETNYVVEAILPAIAFTAPTTASSTSITNTTIRVTDNNAILSTSVIVDPSTTAGTSGFSCTQTSAAIVDCTIVITSSGDLAIKATDVAGNSYTEEQLGYVVGSTPPSVTITAPTKTSNVDITNTTIHVTDNSAILSTNVIVDPSTTVSVHAFSCTQTSSTAVDCTLHIDTSGNLVIKATDNAGNITTQSENNYVIEATPPVIAFTVPTTASSTVITNTTIRITDLNAILAASVTVATSTTAGTSGFSCTQTSGTIVDCTISITSSGNLAIRTVDVAGNVRTDTQTGYVIEAVLPIVTITAPTKTSLSTITDTTIRVTDNYGVLAANVTVDDLTSADVSALICTQTSSTAVDCTIRVETSGSIVINGIDHAGNVGTQTESGYSIITTAPVISLLSAVPASTSATITWATDSLGSSKVVYSPDTSYASTTAVFDTSPYVDEHSVTLTNLVACTNYHYKAVSRDVAGDVATSTDATFTTIGCVGNATPLVETNESIGTGGGILSLSYAGADVTIQAPSGYSALPASFQIKALDGTVVLGAIQPPTGVQAAGSYVWEIHAMLDALTPLSTIAGGVTVTLSYTLSDIVGLDESTLVIYHYSGGSWSPLSSCSVNMSAKTVTCVTTSFSTFGLFATPIVTSGGQGGGSGMSASASVPPRGPFGIALHDGGSSTNKTTVVLDFTASSDIDRMVISQYPDFHDTGIVPVRPSVLWPLCKTATCLPGTYDVYAKFFQSYGIASPLQHLVIAYAPTQGVPMPQQGPSTAPKLIVPKLAVPPLVIKTINRNLRQGDRGEDVKRLQIFLNTHGARLATRGAGAPGRETTIFGPLLRQALIRFQEAHAGQILKPQKLKKGTGIFLGRTRTVINDLIKQGK